MSTLSWPGPFGIGCSRGDDCPARSFDLELFLSPAKESRLSLGAGSLLSERLALGFSLWRMASMERDVLRGDTCVSELFSICVFVNFLDIADTTSLTGFVD